MPVADSSSCVEPGKLRWRCRRGMRELDALLLGWLDTAYQLADDQTRQRFCELLDLQDPEIMRMINSVEHSNATSSSKDSRFDKLIEQIRRSAMG